MMPFHIPGPLDAYQIDWADYEVFPWYTALERCPQDPAWHGEGNVGIHTRMVCQALVDNPEWRDLPRDQQHVVFLAALLHDVSKPETTKTEGGHITSPYHSPKGAIRSRGILWTQGVGLKVREEVAHLIRSHQVPFHFLKKESPERALAKLSITTNLQHLYLLSLADATGRVSQSHAQTIESVTLFRELAIEMGIYQKPYNFHNDHSRFLFCRRGNLEPSVEIFDPCQFAVVMVSGLPGAGKDTYIRARYPDRPVISLDAIRAEKGWRNKEDQGAVVVEAKNRVRALLGEKKAFVYNATNLTKRHRDEWIDLFTDYNARIHIVYVDVPRETLLKQNREREAAVAEKVIDGMIEKWEVPDLTECHNLRWISHGKEIAWPHRT